MDSPSLDQLKIGALHPLRDALTKIDKNGMGVCFVVDENDTIKGILTDGDIRRAILGGKADLNTSVNTVMNSKFKSLPVDVRNDVLIKHLSQEIRIIPLVDEKHKLVDYATINRLRRIPVAGPELSGNELNYITECIETNWVSSQGKFISQFEDQFQKEIGLPVSLAVSNGTVALHLALEALGIGKGDEVIVPDFTFAATINSVIYTGATPVLADVDPKTWTISPESIRRLATNKTKAIMPVHIYGHPCEMGEIMKIAKAHNLMVIEDCAEAVGSRYKEQPVGSFGDAATFSFFGNKTITTGEGGMVLFKDPAIGERARMLRDHGMSRTKRYWHEVIGYNYRMTNMQAALGVAQMERLQYFVQRKRKIAETYNTLLKSVEFIQLPPEEPWAYNTYWLYTFLVKKDAPVTRDQLLTELAGKAIECRPAFYAMHDMPIYKEFGSQQLLKNATFVSANGISLPSSTNLTDEEVEYISRKVAEVFKVWSYQS